MGYNGDVYASLTAAVAAAPTLIRSSVAKAYTQYLKN